jgi:hypothetical protein
MPASAKPALAASISSCRLRALSARGLRAAAPGLRASAAGSRAAAPGLRFALIEQLLN